MSTDKEPIPEARPACTCQHGPTDDNPTCIYPNCYPEGGGEGDKKVEAWPWVNLSVELPKPHTYVLLWVPSRQMSFMATRADRGLRMRWESQYREEIEEGATHWRHLPGGPAPEAQTIADGKEVPGGMVVKMGERSNADTLDLIELLPGVPADKLMKIVNFMTAQMRPYEKALFKSEQDLLASRKKNNDDGIEIARLLAELKEAKGGPAHGWVKASERFPEDYTSVALRRIGTKNMLDNSLIDEADDEWFVYQGDRIYYDEMEWLEILPADASNNKWETRCLDAEKNLTAMIAEALQKSKRLDEAEKEAGEYREEVEKMALFGNTKRARKLAQDLLDKYPSPTPTNKDNG